MIFSAFLDAVDEITVLVDKSIIIDNDFILEYNDNLYKLNIKYKVEEYSWFKYILINPVILDMTVDIHIKNGVNETLLYTGSFVRDPRFDEYYSYDGNLGVFYTKEETVFRIWSPVAKEIYLDLDTKAGKPYTIALSHKGRGLWMVRLQGDFEGSMYRYRVRIFDEYKVITDPYGVSSNSNANYNYVIDPAKIRSFNYPKPEFSGIYTDAIVYEASVRDLTSKLDIDNKGTFKALTNKLTTKKGKAAGLDYIASLGITHLQLMPIFDFYGISDKNPLRYYNWGYNPIQYFVPKGAYATNPDDPYLRINELIELIDRCHQYGMLVNMDVVFNHVNDMKKFPLDNLVPGYFFRTENGYCTNVSGCGNDFATERKMAQKFVLDNLVYMTKTYHFSGYRFDLMGLLDIDTLNKAEALLKKIDPNIMLYGEGWNMPNTLPDNMRPHTLNYRYIPAYAFFNDKFRDYLKGSQWSKNLGYLMTGSKNDYDLYHLVTGSFLDYYYFDNPLHSLNYIECHDNYTLYDYLKSFDVRFKEQDVYEACKLGLSLVILSLGIPFIHCGQEFLRTKNGVENSYNSGDDINGVDWDRKDTYLALEQTVRDLIKIRKEYSVFREYRPEVIIQKVTYLKDFSYGNNFTYKLTADNYELILVVKGKKERFEVRPEDNVTLIFDSNKLCDIKSRKFVFKRKGIYIFRRDL